MRIHVPKDIPNHHIRVNVSLDVNMQMKLMTKFALVLDVTGTEELRQKQGEEKLVKHGTFKHHTLIQ